MTKLVGKVAVQLELPPSYKIHDVFHVALVKAYNGKHTVPPPCDFLDGDPLFTVERLLCHRKQRNKTEFVVKWLGYGPEHNTWEPESNLITCDELIAEYWQSVKDAEARVVKRKARGSGPAAAKRAKR